jgi:hypothetical protein
VSGRQSPEHKDFIVKVFTNKGLFCQRPLKMVLGQLRGASWWRDESRNCPNQSSIVALGGLYVNKFERAGRASFRFREFRNHIDRSDNALVQLFQIGCGNPVFLML